MVPRAVFPLATTAFAAMRVPNMMPIMSNQPIQPKLNITSPTPVMSPIHIMAPVVMTPSATSPYMRDIASV